MTWQTLCVVILAVLLAGYHVATVDALERRIDALEEYFADHDL